MKSDEKAQRRQPTTPRLTVALNDDQVRTVLVLGGRRETHSARSSSVKNHDVVVSGVSGNIR